MVSPLAATPAVKANTVTKTVANFMMSMRCCVECEDVVSEWEVGRGRVDDAYLYLYTLVLLGPRKFCDEVNKHGVHCSIHKDDTIVPHAREFEGAASAMLPR